MKSCPKCNRTFPDEGQKFCTFDGGLLIAQPPAFDPNATIRATSADLTAMSEKPTSRDLPDPNATIAESSFASTVALPRNTAPTGPPPNTAGFGNAAPATPQQPPSPPPPAYSQDQPIAVPSPGVTPPPAPPPQASPTPSTPLPSPPTAAPAVAAAAPKKKSKLPWIIVGVLLFLL